MIRIKDTIIRISEIIYVTPIDKPCINCIGYGLEIHLKNHPSSLIFWYDTKDNRDKDLERISTILDRC